MDEPYRDGNFWFKGGTPQAGVLACYNQVVLLDRRLVAAGELRCVKGPWKWAVYDASNTRYYGEWTGYKTRKAAVKAFVDLALLRPRCPMHDMVGDTIVEAALRERQAYFASVRDEK